MTKTVFQKTVLMFFLLMAMMAHGATEVELGVQDHRLAPCPCSPNCVSSFEDSENHAIIAAPYQ